MPNLKSVPDSIPVQSFNDTLKKNAKKDNIVLITGRLNTIFAEGAIQTMFVIGKQTPSALGSTSLWITKDSLSTKPNDKSIEIECQYYQKEADNIAIPWSFETSIPHKVFRLTEDGLPVCLGIALSIDDIPDIRPPEIHEIYFAKIRETAVIPTKNEEDAGYDIYADFPEDHFIIPANTTRLVPTGIACALHPNWYFQVEERGSTGSKGIKKSAGVIDSGYRGEIFIALTNCNNKTLVITKHPKRQDYLKDMPADLRQPGIITYPYNKAIAQLILHKVPKMTIRTVSYNDLLTIPSGRGTGSLGSSNK